MSIRITTISEPKRTVVKIDGRLKSEEIDELLKTFQALDGPAALDLSELQSADRAGADVLRQLISSGVELRAASPYFELLLRSK